MNDLKLRKNEIRLLFKQKRAEYDDERREILDDAVCRRIISLAGFRYAGALLTYSPIGKEINVHPIAEEARRRGKPVYYPKCGEKTFMDFRLVDSDERLLPGTFGVSEPGDDCPVFDPEDRGAGTVCIVPALSFDRKGYRLGYGGGYYDRYLSRYRGTKIGVVYEEMLSDDLPRGRYDVCVDLIVTEKRIIAINKNR